jgi:hypothetical protein
MTDWIAVYAAIIGTIGFFLTIYFAYTPNKLELSLDDNPQNNYGDAVIQNQSNTPSGRFFHIIVQNNHKRKTAKNSKPYLISLKAAGKENELSGSELQLKWRGYPINIPFIDIPPSESRKFDAFFVLHNVPNAIQMQAFIDSTALLPRVQDSGKYRACYRITADGFRTKEGEFVITLSNQLSGVKIEQL